MDRDKDLTKKYNIKTANVQKKKAHKSNEKNTEKTEKYSKKDTKKSNKKHPKLRLAIKIIIIVLILLCLIGIGVFAAIFFSDKWEISKDDLVIKMQNSITYNKDGKILHELAGDENRKIIPLSEMGEYIPKAYVAIEDERFYKHSGIDIKRTAGAIVTYILNGGSSSFGGSTITQQLVKNLMEDDEDSISRKIREWSRAYKVEQMLSKSQILELYLNEIFMGGTVYGVESGSKYYFNKSAKDLSLAESAFLAGINDSPNYYNPFGDEDKTDIIKDKTKLVLDKMLEVKDENGTPFITQEEHDKAVAEVDKGLKFKEGNFASESDLSFLEVEAINQVVRDLMEEYDLSMDAAKARVYNNGYKIYTTQDNDIQDRMEKEYLKDKYIYKATSKKAEKGAHTQSGMVIMDHKTGKVVGCVGGLGDDSPTYGTNRATSMDNGGRQAGSSFKPISAVAPGLENGEITAATVYDDSRTDFGGDYIPNNSTGYRGLITVREAIAHSSNIVNIKILSNVGVSNSVEFLNEIGMTQFDESDEKLSLALGGTDHGTTPLQMAAAYGMIARGGEYIEPTFYTKVEDANGNVILEAKQETKRVMSEGNAYILSSILTSTVTEGTAYLCPISGMDVAAKTGTTNESKDRWLCGFTPYYTGATWFGYDYPETVSTNMDNPAMTIWSEIMDDIHEDLDGKRFEKPDNIVKAKICLDSGKAATSECTHTYTEEFVSGTVPGKCDGHKKVKVCKETGKLATEFCPTTEEKIYLSTPEKEIKPAWSTSVGNKYKEIKDTCDKHTEKTMTITVTNVIGLTEEAARKALSGLTINIVYGNDSSQTNGVVLKQSIPANTKAKKGSVIELTINKIVEVPPEENTPIDGNNTVDNPNDVVDNPNDVVDGENDIIDNPNSIVN